MVVLSESSRGPCKKCSIKARKFYKLKAKHKSEVVAYVHKDAECCGAFVAVQLPFHRIDAMLQSGWSNVPF